MTTTTPSSNPQGTMPMLRAVVILALVAALAPAHAESAVSGLIASGIVTAHNTLRTAAGVHNRINWDGGLASFAENRARTQAAQCSLSHNGSGGKGENLAMGLATDLGSVLSMVGRWAAEGNHGFNHFTQMAWAQSTRVGCGLAEGCGRAFLACNYEPAGNMAGQTIWTGDVIPPPPPPPPAPKPAPAPAPKPAAAAPAAAPKEEPKKEEEKPSPSPTSDAPSSTSTSATSSESSTPTPSSSGDQEKNAFDVAPAAATSSQGGKTNGGSSSGGDLVNHDGTRASAAAGPKDMTRVSLASDHGLLVESGRAEPLKGSQSAVSVVAAVVALVAALM
ncbi:hypothetical protein AMAG_02013 [Allomyces macrogynus ATCC 38327]|uniref:SCP domain-containing protein n=1 Tax=Allomyces macrogynus (strain ATCC 38327) TaxID=578462 RepID=A0A0L0S1E3_ALLM3|nr:hypothetical protein AMAG_02013 [Allomyces macrogynus ATCC 38327]|eukprot:KNE56179.1 hypothetical protein AMAG_02013 [Allomyces macrogynus ATCC 38327]